VAQELLPGWLWAPMDLATELPELPWRPWNTSIPPCGELGWGPYRGDYSRPSHHAMPQYVPRCFTLLTCPVMCLVNIKVLLENIKVLLENVYNKCLYFVSVLWLGMILLGETHVVVSFEIII
jgi:hypothetical protein